MMNKCGYNSNAALYVSLDVIDIFIFWSLSLGFSKMSWGAHFQLYGAFLDPYDRAIVLFLLHCSDLSLLPSFLASCGTLLYLFLWKLSGEL